MGAQDFLLKMGEVDLYGRGALSIEGWGKGIGGGGGGERGGGGGGVGGGG